MSKYEKKYGVIEVGIGSKEIDIDAMKHMMFGSSYPPAPKLTEDDYQREIDNPIEKLFKGSFELLKDNK